MTDQPSKPFQLPPAQEMLVDPVIGKGNLHIGDRDYTTLVFNHPRIGLIHMLLSHESISQLIKMLSATPEPREGMTVQ